MSETYVLIPGAWHPGWTLRAVAERLRGAGHRVIVLTLPGLSDGDDPRGLRLSDAVDCVVGELDRRDLNQVTLVGHSWAGYPMTGAAHRAPQRISKLVYWSSFVPEDGRSLLEEIPEESAATFRQLAKASGNDTIEMPFEFWRQNLIQDAEEPVQRTLHQLLVPQPFGYMSDGLDVPSVTSLGLPTSYILSTEDNALPPGDLGWSPRFPNRLGVTAIATPGSHEACFTRPAELADAILDAEVSSR